MFSLQNFQNLHFLQVIVQPASYITFGELTRLCVGFMSLLCEFLHADPTCKGSADLVIY